MAQKNKYGQYFTVRVIAEFMVRLVTKPKDAAILEPSCGRGVFLDELLKAGYSDLTAYEIDKSLETGHSFVKYESFVSSPLDEKFDVVIGNPPYIRWKNIEPELKEELQESRLWNRYFNSLCDYSFLFILKSIEQLREGGELIFICTDYWLNTTHSLPLRNYMCRNGRFEEMYRFKEASLFEKVNASFVIFKYRKARAAAQKPVSLYVYNQKGLPTKEELSSLSCFDCMQIPPFKEDTRWLLAPESLQCELQDFEARCAVNEGLFPTRLHRIGDFCDIGNGMVSGLDAAFKLHDVGRLTQNEKGAAIKVLKAKDLAPYRHVNSSTYIDVSGDMSERDFAREYPNFREQLRPFEADLKKRYSYGRDIPIWEFVFPRNRKLFERDEQKIFVPCKERISKRRHFRFCLAPAGFYPLQDVTAILRKETCKESIEYLVAYLNSRRVFDWLCYNGVAKGEIVEFSKAPVASIPYRPIDWGNSQEVMIHDQIRDEVRAYVEDGLPVHLDRINHSMNTLFHENR